MADHTLSEFQQSAERAIAALLAQRGLTIEQREVLSGTMPYAKEPETDLRLQFQGLEVWMLADAASVSGGGRDLRFEQQDFDTPGDMVAALVKELRAIVGSTGAEPELPG